jgi:hypothetical protein
MTEPRHQRRMPRPSVTALAAMALFLAVLVLLAWQVRAGRDPALGAARQRPALVAKARPGRVLVKKIVRRVIDEKVVETDDGPVVVAQTAPAPSGTAVSSAPAVVYSAPAPAPAPAPAAPVVTKTS